MIYLLQKRNSTKTFFLVVDPKSFEIFSFFFQISSGFQIRISNPETIRGDHFRYLSVSGKIVLTPRIKTKQNAFKNKKNNFYYFFTPFYYLFVLKYFVKLKIFIHHSLRVEKLFFICYTSGLVQ